MPLYIQLARVLKDKIASGEYLPGARTPSEPTLAAVFKIGRPTVREALEVLVREGLLEKKRGSGTFVRERVPTVDLFSLAGTSSAFHEKGLSITQALPHALKLVRVPADPENPFQGTETWFFSRLSRQKRIPVLLEEIWLDPELFRGIDRFDFASRSLALVVGDEYYLTPLSCRQAFRAGVDAKRGRLLGTGAGIPLLIVSRTLFFRDRVPGIFARLYCRTDRFSFSQTITRPEAGF